MHLRTQAILRDVLSTAGISETQVLIVVAGVAGLDSPADLDWAFKNTAIPGLTDRRILINDSHIALAGAFLMDTGILSIAGTGAITTGYLENGE